MRETWIRSLGWEDPLEEGMAIHSSILAWRIPWIEEPGGLSPWGCKESDMTEVTEHTSSQFTVFKKGVTLNVPESHPRGFCASDISAYLEFKSPNGKILRQGERQAV